MTEIVETIDPLDQDRRMRQVLVEMQLLMYGSAMSWQSSVSSGKPSGGSCPPGESQPLHTIWQQKYVLAADHDRETVIAGATDALIAARVRVAPIPQGETRQEWEERLITDGEGWPAKEVAVRYLTGVREVVKLRMRYEREPCMGSKLEDRASVAELVRRGLSARQIAFITGKAPSTAQYYVNKFKRAA